MTTEKETFEAQEILKEFRKGLDSLSEYKLIGALDMAIEVLNHSEIPNGSGKDANVPSNDTISRQAAIDALDGEIKITGRTNAEAVNGYVRLVKDRLERLPSAQPDNRLSKIAELVEGTIDHLDRDDAMDLLYQIKEVLK